jgi:uncharacterized protein (DUF302 family)
MGIRQIAVERFSLVSAKPFREVMAIIDAAIGHPDMRQLVREIAAAPTYAEMENAIRKAAGTTDLLLFMRLDIGEVLNKGNAGAKPQSQRLLVGNPLIMRQMAEQVPDTGSYAPVTILVDERIDGVHVSYDRMTSFLAPYQSAEALRVATELDLKVETLLKEAAGESPV